MGQQSRHEGTWLGQNQAMGPRLDVPGPTWRRNILLFFSMYSFNVSGSFFLSATRPRRRGEERGWISSWNLAPKMVHRGGWCPAAHPGCYSVGRRTVKNGEKAPPAHSQHSTSAGAIALVSTNRSEIYGKGSHLPYRYSDRTPCCDKQLFLRRCILNPSRANLRIT